MKAISELRAAFWEAHKQFQPERRQRKRQNQYRTDIRCAFVDFVDHLQKSGEISESLAFRATL